MVAESIREILHKADMQAAQDAFLMITSDLHFHGQIYGSPALFSYFAVS